MLMNDLNKTRATVLIHTVGAIVAGMISIQIAAAYRSLYAIGFGILLLIIIGFISERLAGKKGFKFWFANGIWIYIFFWVVTWVYLFNI